MALPRSRFSPVPVEELYRRSEEEKIIAYAAHAKRENALPEALLSIQLMLYLHDDRMSAGWRCVSPTSCASPLDGECLGARARNGTAYKLEFEGGWIGEWVNWWRTAVDRQVIAFWRSAQGQALQAETRLASEHEGEDDARATTSVPVRRGCRPVARALRRHRAVRPQPHGQPRCTSPHPAGGLRRPRLRPTLPPSLTPAPTTSTPHQERFRDAVRTECIARGITES